MATVPYLSSSPWWSASNLNTLCGEFDRRLTLALAGKTPYLLANYGVGDQTLITTDDRRFPLPIAQYSGAAVVKGIGFPEGVLGAVYCFKGSTDGAPVVYLERTTSYSQSTMDSDAAAATEVSHDTTAKVVVVDDSAATISLEWSLKSLKRTVSSVSCWLAPTTVSGRRAMRKHRYAVAELVLESIDEFTVPRTWNRYGCFRVHNLSAIEVTVTVETYEADGTTSGTSQTITVPKFGCKSFRREPGYYDASWSYLWKARAGLDKRFYQPSGAWVVEQSAKANNISHPNIIADWLDILGAQRDPYVDPPSEWPRYSALFGDPSDPSTKIHDLIAHKGSVKSIGWDVSSAPVYASGSVGDSSTLVADLAAIGITATITGDTYALARASSGAPGLSGGGLDLFTLGSNLMWLQAQTVTVPGHTGFSRAEVQRQYSTLPVTLVEDVTVGVLINPAPSGYAASYPTASLYTGSDYTVTRLSEIGDAANSVGGPYVSISDWRLTPFGFAAQWSYSFTITSTNTVTGPEIDPMNGGIWDRWSSTTISRKSWLHIKSPGWSLGSLKPTRWRSFGKHVFDSSGPGFWQTEDWAGILSDVDGAEPTATGKVLIDVPELKYLSDITGDTVGDVYDVVTLGGGGTGPADLTETRYHVRPDSDEARSAAALIGETLRVQYNQGTPTLEGGETPSYYYHRRPMQLEDYNGLAWMVNGWTRTAPLVTIKNLWLKRTNAADFTGLYIPNFQWEGSVFPRNAAFSFVPGNPTANWTKANWSTILTVLEREDQPHWTEAKSAYGHTRSWDVDYGYWERNKRVISDPTPRYICERTQQATQSTQYDGRSGIFTGSYFDKPDVDSAFGWFSTDDVATLASSKGLPYVHSVWGSARKLEFLDVLDDLPAPPFDGTEFDELSAVSPFTTTPPLTDEYTSSGTTLVGAADGWADHVPALTSDDFEYIFGAACAIDALGSPIDQLSDCWNRGDASITGNSVTLWTCISDPNITVDPYYPSATAQAKSESKAPVGANLIFSGYTGSNLNSRLLLGTGTIYAMATYDPFTNATTTGSFTTNSTVAANVLSTGYTYHLPTAVKTQPATLVHFPFVDLT